jgi:hypothetical protein
MLAAGAAKGPLIKMAASRQRLEWMPSVAFAVLTRSAAAEVQGGFVNMLTCSNTILFYCCGMLDVL